MRAQCHHCRKKPARDASRFCTLRCAAQFAEEQVSEDAWCEECNTWWGLDAPDYNSGKRCGRCETPLDWRQTRGAS